MQHVHAPSLVWRHLCSPERELSLSSTLTILCCPGKKDRGSWTGSFPSHPHEGLKSHYCRPKRKLECLTDSSRKCSWSYTFTLCSEEQGLKQLEEGVFFCMNMDGGVVVVLCLFIALQIIFNKWHAWSASVIYRACMLERFIYTKSSSVSLSSWIIMILSLKSQSSTVKHSTSYCLLNTIKEELICLNINSDLLYNRPYSW